jgi:CheY-like chemotaxis protein
MPGMDGLEAIRRIRADADLADIPIIALTALAMPGDLERCLEAGANGYMSKPFGLRALMGTIETQLCREAARKR